MVILLETIDCIKYFCHFDVRPQGIEGHSKSVRQFENRFLLWTALPREHLRDRRLSASNSIGKFILRNPLCLHNIPKTVGKCRLHRFRLF